MEEKIKVSWLKSNWYYLLMTIIIILTFLSNVRGWASSRVDIDNTLKEKVDASQVIIEHHIKEDNDTFARKTEVEQHFRFIEQSLADIKETLKVRKN